MSRPLIIYIPVCMNSIGLFTKANSILLMVLIMIFINPFFRVLVLLLFCVFLCFLELKVIPIIFNLYTH